MSMIYIDNLKNNRLKDSNKDYTTLQKKERKEQHKGHSPTKHKIRCKSTKTTKHTKLKAGSQTYLFLAWNKGNKLKLFNITLLV